MHPAILIFLGGGLGSVCRYALSHGATRVLGDTLPFGTLAVNLLGAFAIGFLADLLALKLSLPPAWRYALMTGFLGGFTTFSAFSFESALLWQRGDYAALGVYIVLSVVGTIALVLLGAAVARQLA